MQNELDKRIDILKPNKISDGYGMVKQGYTTFATGIHAKKTDVSDQEKTLTGAKIGHLISRFLVRKNSITRAIQPEDAVNYAGKTYHIEGIKDLAKDDAYLELTGTVFDERIR